MANPQKENGYTAIANDILDALIKIRISGEAMKVLFFVFRKTYGFNKTKDTISLSQFCIATDMPKSSVARGIRYLRARKLIKTIPHKYSTEYSVNKDYDEWIDVYAYDRLEIFKRDLYMCHICHSVKDVTDLEVDHIIPLWLNGPNSPNNLKACCRTCNRRKGSERLRFKPTVAELPQLQKVNQDCDNIATKTVTILPQTKDNIQKTIYKRKTGAPRRPGKNKLKDNTPVKKPSGEDIGKARQIVDIIDTFVKSGVNPSCAKLYNNTTQRNACANLIEIYGFDKTVWVINFLPRTKGEEYMPYPTTPIQLFNDWAKLEARIIKYKAKLLNKNNPRGDIATEKEPI